VVGLLKGQPPLGQGRAYFAGAAAQFQEVKGGAKARVGEQGIGTAAAAPLKTGLQIPDLTHGQGKTARHRHPPGGLLEQFGSRPLQGEGRGLPGVFLGGTLSLQCRPEQGGKKKGGGYRLACGDALIGALQGQLQEAS
jgi:hypothetical protein